MFGQSTAMKLGLATAVVSVLPGIIAYEQSSQEQKTATAILGADISWVQQWEAQGVRYSDHGERKFVLQRLSAPLGPHPSPLPRERESQ